MSAEKNQVSSNKQRKRVVWVGEKRRQFRVLSLFKDKAYIYMYYYCLIRK